MNISVTKDNVIIIEDSNLPHENEYKITKCYFTFDEFTDSFQVKRAIFTILSTGEKFQTDIINNECYVPVDVLKNELETIKIGVYSFDIETIEEDGKEKEVLKQRTSPSYTTFVVPSGSYEEGALSPEIITPTQYDIYSQALQEGLTELEEGLEEVSHVDIDASKSEGVSTVTITNRHNQEKTVEILDGEDGYTPVKGVDYFTTAEIEEIEGTVKEQVKTDLDFDNTVNRINQDILDLNTNKASKTELENEKNARELADANLQSQIDAIESGKDVVDIVGTYSDLQNYDTSTLTEDDVIKVLDDSTHNNAMSYYRWASNTWNYIGSEGPFYTKSETDSLLNTKQATIDSSHKLASDLVDDTNQTHKFTNENEKTTWNAKYDKPSNGIPKSDLVESVQESLNKADSAIQDVSDKEDKSNKVTEINSSSTDTEYPSAKCVYDSQVAQDNEIDTLKMIYNILPTDTDTGETISIDNTGEMPIKSIQLGGNTSQVVIPAETGTNVNATSISISDVDTDKEHTIGIDGNTYQETTTGANLNIFPYGTGGNGNGITFTINNDGTVVLNGTNNGNGNSSRLFYNKVDNPMVLEARRYYMIPPNNTNIVYVMTDGTNYYSFNNNNGYSQLFNSNIGIKQFYVQVAKNNTTTFTNEKIYPMLATTQVTQSDWEKYTGGQPSPNPDYPQNIEVVTGTNNIEVCGKNLLNTNNVSMKTGANFNGEEDNVYSTTTNNYNSFVIVPVPSNTNITLSMNNADYSNTRFYVSCLKNKTTEAGKVGGWYTRSGTILTTEKTHYLGIVIQIRVTGSTTSPTPTQELIDALNIQVEVNNTVTTYEQYQGTTYPINLGNIELCKIPTYQDRIYKKNDKWYLEKKTGKITLNGTEEWGTVQAYSRAWPVVEAPNILVSTSATDLPYLYCNYYNAYKLGDIVNSNPIDYGIGKRSNHSELLVRNKDADTVASLKTWLNTHNTIVYYALATPTTTEITDTSLVNQLNALYNATIYPITNINTDTSNLLPYIDLHYNFVTPSPSPSRPSVVNVVKGENTLTICGKNLFNLSNAIKSQNIYIPNPIKETGNYTISCANSNSSFSFASCFVNNIGDATSDRIGGYLTGYDFGDTRLSYTQSVTSEQINANYILLALSNTNTTIENIATLKVQLEKGSTATTYEPYVSQTYQVNLPSGLELCKISTYQDYFYKDNGNWYKHSEIGKIVLNGTENWQTELYTYYLTNFNAKPYSTFSPTTPYAYANYFKWGNGSSGSFSEGSFWYTLDGSKLRVQKDNPLDLNTFKTWLSTNNTIVYYAINTPTNTQITDTTLITQLDNLQKAISYDSQTNISQTNEDKPFIITVEMFLSLKNVLN